MRDTLLSGHELEYLLRLGVALVCGLAIGLERELRGKPAGISTNCFVIAGAALFTVVSQAVDPNSPARIAAQVVSGVGFLGAGVILKSEGGNVKNLTTAAEIWLAAAIGMAIGFGWFVLAGMTTAYALLVSQIPNYKKRRDKKRASTQRPGTSPEL